MEKRPLYSTQYAYGNLTAPYGSNRTKLGTNREEERKKKPTPRA